MPERHKASNKMRAATSLLLGTCCLSAVTAQTLPLRHGKYVVESSSCSDAPNAAILHWDGAGFSGAHSSQCTSHSTHLSDGSYRVTTACMAVGDGSPAPSKARAEVAITVRRISDTKFVISSNPDRTYRWCRP